MCEVLDDLDSRACVTHRPTIPRTSCERSRHERERLWPLPQNQGLVDFFDPSFDEELLEATESLPILAEEQAATRLTIETVSWGEEGDIRTACTHEVHDPEAESTASVDGEPSGFVEDEASVVFIKDTRLNPTGIETRWGT